MTTALRYTVLPGDTLSSIVAGISASAGATDQTIEAANPGLDPNTLAVGQVIDIPAAGSAPTPAVVPMDDHAQIGFWRRTWVQSATPPDGCNLGLAFSGWAAIKQALKESSTVYSSLPGLKYITLGGGNAKGAFTATNLQIITDAIDADMFAQYAGIAYDVEEGDSGLGAAFAQSFAAAKAKGFKVLVTTSHSAPYGFGDAVSLMRSFFANPNIDFLSPQLYTMGAESHNQYTTTGYVTWKMYAGAQAKVIPSLVKASMYADAQTYFAQHGVTLAGFVQWSQN